MIANTLPRWERRKTLLLLSFLLLSFFTFFMLPTFADSGTRGIQKVVKSMIQDICTLGVDNGVIGILTANIKTKYASAWGSVQTVVDTIIIPVSYSVLGIYFVTAIASWGLKMDGLTMEMITRPFIYYIAAFLLVQYTPYFITVGISSGADFAGKVVGMINSGATGNASEMAASVYSTINSEITGFFPGFAKMMQLLLPWIISKLLAILLQVVAYSVVIEIFVTGIFLPLSFGPVIQHGIDGSGFRYLKRFIALCCQGGVMLIVAAIGSQFASIVSATSADWNGFLKGTFEMLVAQGATAMLMLKAGELCRSALGA